MISDRVKGFASRIGLKFYLHDDSNMPPLCAQQAIFNRAAYVFSFHGAAGIHLLAMRGGTTFVEIFEPTYLNTCFEVLAMYMGVNYYSMVRRGSQIPLEGLLDRLVEKGLPGNVLDGP